MALTTVENSHEPLATACTDAPGPRRLVAVGYAWHITLAFMDPPALAIGWYLAAVASICLTISLCITTKRAMETPPALRA